MQRRSHRLAGVPTSDIVVPTCHESGVYGKDLNSLTLVLL